MSRFTKQPDKYVVLQGTKFAETEKAMRFYVTAVEGNPIPESLWKSLWLPLSQIKSITTAAPGSKNLDEVSVKEWLWNAKIKDDFGGKNPVSVSSATEFLNTQDELEEDFGELDGNLPF